MEVYYIFIADVKHLFSNTYKYFEKGIKDCKRSFIPFLFAKSSIKNESQFLTNNFRLQYHKPIFLSFRLKFLLFFITLPTFICCKSKENTHRLDTKDPFIYSTENYSELKIDTTLLVNFFKVNPAIDSIQHQVAQFYSCRGFQDAWLNSNGLSQAAINFYEQLQSDSEIFSDKSLKNNVLDSLFLIAFANEKQFFKQAQNVEKLEILLTVTFFKYAEKVYGGATKNTRNLDWFIPRKKKSFQKLLDSLVSNNSENMIQEPVNEYYTRLKEKLKLYRNIQQQGGFTEIIVGKKLPKLGDSASYIIPIKKHLAITGNLKENDNTPIFTTDLEKALIDFQHRMGLMETGKIDNPTLKELNEPVDFRIKQIMVNLERLRWVPVEMEKDYLLVNIPEFRLHVFENHVQIWQTNVVVGKAARRTSIFKGNMSTLVLNPYWGIPPRIAQEEIIPKINRNPNYLSQNNMEVINGNYRQKPGINNALGKMKFLFPNNYSIYLHDTPSKSLFKENVRAFSHGCIRVENPKKLAFHLLKNNADWPESRINEVLKTDVNTNIKISPTMPVYIAYFTAWVDNMGQMNFRHDLYDLDNKLSKEIFGE